MASVPSDEKVWYEANCHCRQVRLRLRIRPLYATKDERASSSTEEPFKVWNCNCSICTKNGYLNIYPDDYEKDIEWISGKDDLTEYEYGPCERSHKFCPKCGSSVALFNWFGKNSENKAPKIGINVRLSFVYGIKLNAGYLIKIIEMALITL
ncbi:MAG: hypothetical protein Q9209_002372 [Squamulea sp. 1 TL-2023]